MPFGITVIGLLRGTWIHALNHELICKGSANRLCHSSLFPQNMEMEFPAELVREQQLGKILALISF